MKRRGWRVALTVAAIGLALVAGLLLFNWPTVRDHAEAWWFQATRETAEMRQSGRAPQSLWFLAVDGRRPVVYDPVALDATGDTLPLDTLPWEVLDKLRKNGYRVIEQRFPRRAYVVVSYPVVVGCPPPAPFKVLSVEFSNPPAGR